MVRNTVSGAHSRDTAVHVKQSSAKNKKQVTSPLRLLTADAGSAALIEGLHVTQVPIHEPEVTDKKLGSTKIKTKLKISPKKTAKTKTKLPAKVAKKTAYKSPAKRAPSAKSNVPAALDAGPPWHLQPIECAANPNVSPLPRGVSLQVYSKNNWLGSVKYWVRSNVFSFFNQQKKTVAVIRPNPKKLNPREMVAELNRLAEENRTLHRQISKLQKDI